MATRRKEWDIEPMSERNKRNILWRTVAMTKMPSA